MICVNSFTNTKKHDTNNLTYTFVKDTMIPFDSYLAFYLALYSWQDCAEIIAFWFFTYKFLYWLKTSCQPYLIHNFLSYCMLLFIAYYAQLPVLLFLLLYLSPVLIILYITFHQTNLQKNFITALTTTQETTLLNNSWHNELLKIILHALNKNKGYVCIIERNDSLETILKATHTVNSGLTYELAALFIDSSLNTLDNIQWLNQWGRLIALKTKWELEYDDPWFAKENAHVSKWHQDALFLTSKTDCIIIRAIPERTFESYMQGKIVSYANATDLVTFLKKHCAVKEYFNASNSYKNNQEQSLS